jgi:hypothetical protein
MKNLDFSWLLIEIVAVTLSVELNEMARLIELDCEMEIGFSKLTAEMLKNGHMNKSSMKLSRQKMISH